MMANLVKMTAGLVAVMLLAGPLAAAQDQPPPGPAPSNQAAPQYTQAQLEQVLAPIALYPDSLLAQILMAATYPLEVVEADRWLQDQNNAALKGDQLAAAMEQQNWDPSVKALVAFPQILRMMDGKLDWTERLGDAFLADQAAVMDSVQHLRQRAQAAGRLQSTPQQVVTAQGPTIVIQPPTPETVYVPVYDPGVVYGDWPYPLFPPFYFPGFFSGVVFGGFGYGWYGFPVVGPLWGWCHWNWGHHWIDYDRDRWTHLNHNHPPHDGGNWQHDPFHRHGVPYQNPVTRARFAGPSGSPDVRRTYRGYPAGPGQPFHPAPAVGRPAIPRASGSQASGPQSGFAHPPTSQVLRGQSGYVRPPPAPPAYRPQPGSSHPISPQVYRAPQVYRPPPAPRVPPSFESFGRGAEVRMQANRGYSSRSSMPSVPPRAPSFQPPAPSFQSRGPSIQSGGHAGGSAPSDGKVHR